MIYNQYQQYELSDRIMQAVCEVGKVTFMELCSAVKTVKLNTLRGLYCLISRDYCIHPDRSARLLCRTRANGTEKQNPATSVRIRLYVCATCVLVSFVKNTAKY